MSGDLGAHDPTILKAGGRYYAYSTGIERTADNPGGILVHVSDGGLGGPWRKVGEIPVPGWVKSGYAPKNIWAPEVVQSGGTFYLYYAASQFGTNRSAIGVATTTTPGNPASWRDSGAAVVRSGGTNYNAIDPDVFNDGGQWWIAYGSFFSGIKLQRLGSMTAVTGGITTLATRPGVAGNPVEAPSIVKRGNFYYLFTSWDLCCRGLGSTYSVRVGRATAITGPYLDKNGVRLDAGGGSLVLGSRLNQTGPGGQDLLQDGTAYNLVYHYYDTTANGAPKLAVRQLGWSGDWPVP